MIEKGNNEEKQLGGIAEFYALKLTSTSISVAERSAAAQRLRSVVSALLAPGGAADQGDWLTRLYKIVEQISHGVIAMLALDRRIIFADAKPKFEIAYSLMGVLDEMASSDGIALPDKVPLVRAAESLINPSLRAVSRLTDPDRVEYGHVGDAAIRLGSTAMTIAWRASAIVEDRGRDLRQAGIHIH